MCRNITGCEHNLYECNGVTVLDGKYREETNQALKSFTDYKAVTLKEIRQIFCDEFLQIPCWHLFSVMFSVIVFSYRRILAARFLLSRSLN